MACINGWIETLLSLCSTFSYVHVTFKMYKTG